MGKRAPWIVAVAAFVVSRVAYYLAGLRFSAAPVYYFVQLFDPLLLQHRLAESLWYQHGQPPLYNLLTALALRLAPNHWAGFLWGVFLLVGLTTLLVLLDTLRGLGLPTWWATAVAILFCCAPPFVLYESWYFYPQLELLLLQLAAWGLVRAGGAPGRPTALALWALAAMVWLRPVFHPFYLLLVIAGLLWLAPAGERRPLVRSAAGPAALVLLLLAKNVVVFGLWGTSSWGGNSLHRVVTADAPRDQIKKLVEAGELSPISMEWEFSTPQRYIQVLRLQDPHWGVPALDQPNKSQLAPESAYSAGNFNHWAYLAASKVYLRDALHIMRRFPGAYLSRLRWNWNKFLQPVTRDGFLRTHFPTLRRVAERLEWLDAVLLATFPLGVVVALMALYRRRVERGERVFLLFVLGTVAWSGSLSVLMETGENNRFRYHMMGLVLLLACFTARRAWLGARPLIEKARRPR